MKFREVIGQDEAKQRLLHLAHEGKVPHALLLCGPAGSGKMALAMAFASYMLCKNHIDDDTCGTCRQCSMLENWAHPDLHFSFPVIKPTGTSAEHKMSSDDFSKEWRHMLESGPYFTMDRWLAEMNAANQQAQIGVGESISLLHKLSLKSSQGGYKISIIWLPERMNAECANKMLKMIEEPPSETLFILVSEEPEKLLDTIKSRAQRIDVKRIDAKIIEQALIDQRGIEPQAAHSISRTANGSWLHALEELAADNEKHMFFDLFVTLMRLAYTRNIKELRKWSENVAALGREKQKRMLLYFLHLIRENFIRNFNISQLNYMNDEEENFSRNFSRFINEANIFEIVDLFNRAIRDIGQNANAKIVFFDVATRLIVALIRK